MTPEQKAAFVMARAATLMAAVAGMQAENEMRARRGESPAYTEDDFAMEITDAGINHNQVVEFFRD